MKLADEARTLVLEHGWNSTCYQILNEGIERWLSSDSLGVVGFVRYGNTAVIAGAPVCSEEHLAQIITMWETYATGQGLSVCYFGGEKRLQQLLTTSSGYAQVVLGYQPEWHPKSFVRHAEVGSSLRAQLNRAKNKGVEVSEWPRSKAENNQNLRTVLNEWLANRGLPTLHFLVEPETLSDLRDRRIFVAEQRGKVVGFVTLCPVPARQGWLTEQFVRINSAPNGTVEFMLYHAVRTVAEEGAEYITMGLIPLMDRPAISLDEPKSLRIIRRLAYGHMNRFYNFRGLFEFKSKFRPDVWQPVVAIVKEPQFKLIHLRAIVGAFTGSLPELALAKGILKAAKTELGRLFTGH